MPPIHLGPFHLVEPLAKGGMGVVWRAVHAEQGVPVAVKVIHAEAAREEKYLQNFRNEVRAAAVLDHPGAVLVLDHGEVDAAAAAASRSALSEGAPYLAMELASGGSLVNVKHALGWRELKAILLTVLDALAHAHARGVVHRDLKPGNVLICTEDDVRPGVKLSDFGIAHALDWHARSGVVENTAGTLHYMAPEQLLGHWRDYGPWTDLYSLGCMAYRLAAGHVPFTGLKGAAILRAQLYQDPPPLVPRRPVPGGFEEWLGALVKKDPFARYQRAADAAWALLALGDPDEADAPPDTVIDVEVALSGAEHFEDSEDDAPTEVPAGAEPMTLPSELIEVTPGDEPLRSVDARAPRPPPIPPSWRRPIPPAPPLQLVGAGLGLYGLRRIPLVGREPERTALWDALREVHRTRSAGYVLVQGPAGVGKSRLVEWVAERAHELGAAHVVRATHGSGEDPGEALARMVSKTLRCGRLQRADVLERVDEFLAAHGCDDEQEALALSDLLAPSTDDPLEEGTVVRLLSARERHVTVRRFLERLASHRPVIAWFDDVHWSPEAIAFTEHLLDRQATAHSPILVVHTVADEQLGAVPDVAPRLQELLKRPRARHLDLEPLPSAATAELVRGLLLLDEALAVDVEERSAGNPMFAVLLVGDWVQRKVLEVGPSGFRLRDGEMAELPDDVHEIWTGRVAQVLEGLPEDARIMLELAACLGLEVDEYEWQEVCEDPARSGMVGANRVAMSIAGLRLRADLVDRLLAMRLAEETERGWAFAHGMLRESLERQAREGARWARHNQSCAAVLSHRSPNAWERIGRHLVQAGELEAALAPLLQGVSRAWGRRGVRPALALLATCEGVMNELALPEQDPRWGRVWTERARLLCLQGATVEAAASARAAVKAAKKWVWPEVLPYALYEVARVAMATRRHDEAESRLLEVHDLCRRSGDGRLLGKSLMGLGIISSTRGDAQAAARLLHGARRCFEKEGSDRQLSQVLGHMGVLERRSGDLAKARELLDEAVALAERTGDRNTLAEAVNSRAEVLRSAGEHDEAAREYERAYRLYQAMGAWQAVLCRLNLGLLAVHRAAWREARNELEETRRALERLGRRHLLAAAHLALLPCAAAGKEWSTWDRNLDAARALIAETGFADVDNGWAAALAGDIAHEAGEGIRAVAAWQLAADQYEAAGATDAAMAALTKVAELGG